MPPCMRLFPASSEKPLERDTKFVSCRLLSEHRPESLRTVTPTCSAKFKTFVNIAPNFSGTSNPSFSVTQFRCSPERRSDLPRNVVPRFSGTLLRNRLAHGRQLGTPRPPIRVNPCHSNSTSPFKGVPIRRGRLPLRTRPSPTIPFVTDLR